MLYIERMDTYMAFFDESGNPQPDHASDFYSLGMVVVRSDEMLTINNNLRSIIYQVIAPNAELKLSVYLSILNKLKNNVPLTAKEKQYIIMNLEKSKYNSLLIEIFEYIMNTNITLLGISIHKNSNWLRFTKDTYHQYLSADGITKNKLKGLLTDQILSNALPYLLQRLQYYLEEVSGISIVIGDENSYERNMHIAHASKPAGISKYTDLSLIVNNVVFGSSIYNPVLQLADVVAHALNRWSRSRDDDPYAKIIDQIKDKFRGAPSHIVGKGVVLNPDNYAWPKI